MSKSQKSCFGSDHYYNETSRGCIRCGDYRECGRVVNSKVNSTSTWRSTTRPTTPLRRNLPSYGGNKTVQTPTVIRGTTVSSYYNFDEAVLPQLAKYAGFSVAEVCLEELQTLVAQAREDYIDRVSRVVEVVDPVEIVPTKKK